MKLFLEKYILSVVLIPLCILFVSASYVRFVVTEDYLVSYEISCDPEEQPCYVGCEDEECTTEYYYSVVEKHATELEKQCGNNIVDCPKAGLCLPEDVSCTISTCDPSIEECYQEDSSLESDFNDDLNAV